jgi:hypothetical protein
MARTCPVLAPVTQIAGNGADWGHWQGPSQVQPICWVSVYYPHTGPESKSSNWLPEIYKHISAELTYYSSKPGTVCLMEDWIGHVLASSNPYLPIHLHHLAPTLGLGDQNATCRALLDFYSAHGCCVVPQHVHLPPNAGLHIARLTFVRDSFTSIVDCVRFPFQQLLAELSTRSCRMTPPRCIVSALTIRSCHVCCSRSDS